MTVVIIDYGSGNLHSAAKAFERESTEKVVVTADPKIVAGADRIVLPGVGAFNDCKKGVTSAAGMSAGTRCAGKRPALSRYLCWHAAYGDDRS